MTSPSNTITLPPLLLIIIRLAILKIPPSIPCRRPMRTRADTRIQAQPLVPPTPTILLPIGRQASRNGKKEPCKSVWSNSIVSEQHQAFESRSKRPRDAGWLTLEASNDLSLGLVRLEHHPSLHPPNRSDPLIRSPIHPIPILITYPNSIQSSKPHSTVSYTPGSIDPWPKHSVDWLYPYNPSPTGRLTSGLVSRSIN